MEWIGRLREHYDHIIIYDNYKCQKALKRPWPSMQLKYRKKNTQKEQTKLFKFAVFNMNALNFLNLPF